MTSKALSALLLAAALISGSISIVPILPVVLVMAGVHFVMVSLLTDHGLRITGPVRWFLLYMIVSFVYAALIGVDLFDLGLYRREFKFFVPFSAFVVFSSLRYPKGIDRTVVRALLFIAAVNAVLFLVSPALALSGLLRGLYADGGNIWEPYSSAYFYLGLFFSHSGGGGWFAAAAMVFLSISRVEGLAPSLQARFRASSVLFFLLLFLSFSRAYALAAIVVLGLLVLRRWLDRRFFVGIAVLSVVLLGSIGVPYLGTRISSESLISLSDPLSTPRYNVVARYVLWGKAIEDFVYSPLVGVGVTRFDDDYMVLATIPREVEVMRDLDLTPQYFRAPLVRVNVGEAQAHTDQQAHNMYLHVLAEGGLLMFVLMVLAITSMIRWARGVMRSAVGFRRGVARGVCWAMYVVLVAGLFGNSFFTVTPMFFLLSLAGYLNSVAPEEGLQTLPIGAPQP